LAIYLSSTSDLDYVEEVRALQPLEAHRRRDLYSLVYQTPLPTDHDSVLLFGPNPIPAAHIFYRDELTYAFGSLFYIAIKILFGLGGLQKIYLKK
jgi:hypothetical protein